MSEVAVNAFRVIGFAVDSVTFAAKVLSGEVSREAFTHLTIHAVAITAALWAVGDIA